MSVPCLRISRFIVSYDGPASENRVLATASVMAVEQNVPVSITARAATHLTLLRQEPGILGHQASHLKRSCRRRGATTIATAH